MWTCWTTRCCSALALAVIVAAAVSAQTAGPRPFPVPKPKPSKKLDRTPFSLFPVRPLWVLELNNQITVPPAYDTGHGYFAIEQNRVVAYDLSTGTLLWIVEARPLMEPAVGEGLLFLIEPEMLTARRTSDGTIAWQLPFAEKLAVPPVWDNGWLIAATTRNDVLAFRAADGHLIWRRAIGSIAHARPTLATDRLYLPTDDGRVVTLRVDTGAPLWERTIGGAATDILALGDRLYVGSKNNYIYCLKTEDGRIDWKWRTGGDVVGVPVMGDRSIYVVSLDNVLRALHYKSGGQLWKTELLLRPTSGPVKAGDTLLVTGAVPPLRGYNAEDGKSAGELPAAGEMAAPPHLVQSETAIIPVVILVSRDIAKGATVSAFTRDFEPPIVPIAPLPNVIPMNPAGAVVKP